GNAHESGLRSADDGGGAHAARHVFHDRYFRFDAGEDFLDRAYEMGGCEPGYRVVFQRSAVRWDFGRAAVLPSAQGGCPRYLYLRRRVRNWRTVLLEHLLLRHLSQVPS